MPTKFFKKGQTAIEFVALVGTLLFVFATFFFVIQQNTSEKEFRKEIDMANEIASMVRNEIGIATKASNGYSRNFTVPYKLDGKNYKIELNDTEKMIFIQSSRVSTALGVERVLGTVQIGNNQIRKQFGVVCINREPCTDCVDWDESETNYFLIPSHTEMITTGEKNNDNCTDMDRLNEFYCQDNKISFIVINCTAGDAKGKGKGGCYNGKCYTCTDTDFGRNYTVKGVVRTNTQNYYDSCSGPYLLENYCENGQRKATSFPCLKMGSGYQCIDGACKSTAPVCGDGVVEPPTENCDPPQPNSPQCEGGANCRADCTCEPPPTPPPE